MTSQHNTGTHPFYIGMYIHICTHIYVHIYTSQKECLCIFSPRLPWPVGKLFLALLYILQQMLKVPGTALASGLQHAELWMGTASGGRLNTAMRRL